MSNNLQSLYVNADDLVLARACVAGNELAWETLVARYRPKLYAIACRMTGDESSARELADSVFAELFGLRKRRDGSHCSKLAYYTGRASLESWLRAVLAQTYTDEFRSRRRLVPIDDAGISIGAAPTIVGQEPLLAEALDAALLDLDAEDRFLLAAHYLDSRSKAEIGRMLAIHETTVGRRIEKALRNVRSATIRNLRQRGLSRAAAADALNCDILALEIDIRDRLLLTRQA